MKPASALAAALLGAAVLTASGQQQPAQSVEERIRTGLATADVNKDGVIDVDEMVGHSLYLFKQYDRNRDGVLTPDELPKHDPARMRRADRTGDGRLSHSEVAADKVYEFFEIDTDRNGVVSVQEVLAYEARLRTAGK
jgi:Ca2+-binding EF-hand superfamily protein